MNAIREIALVFVGGGLGSIIRFLLGRWVNAWHSYNFPLGTLAVNIFACLVLGYVVGIADHRQLISPAARLFWTVGFCGGFSTFSTFSSETLVLLQGGFHLTTALYIILSLLFCLAATFTGIYLGEHS